MSVTRLEALRLVVADAIGRGVIPIDALTPGDVFIVSEVSRDTVREALGFAYDHGRVSADEQGGPWVELEL